MMLELMFGAVAVIGIILGIVGIKEAGFLHVETNRLEWELSLAKNEISNWRVRAEYAEGQLNQHKIISDATLWSEVGTIDQMERAKAEEQERLERSQARRQALIIGNGTIFNDDGTVEARFEEPK